MAIKLVAFAAVIAVLLLLLIWTGQRRLMYVNVDGAVGEVEDVLPGASAVHFETADGLRLAGWWLPAAPLGAVSILFCNGNAGHREYRAPLADALVERGFNVLLFDYRGYGGNPGAPTERGLRYDVRAAREWLETRSGTDPRGIVLIGESLGAAVALAEAVERPPAALVLRSPFLSGVDIAGFHFPYLPARLLVRDRWRSDVRIRRLTSPLLVVAGGEDRIVPPEQSRLLFDRASVHKQWVVLDGAGHNDAEFGGDGPFVESVERWLRELEVP
jgi:fermentation-respiration switch protein FrsA (DUF1100 family)